MTYPAAAPANSDNSSISRIGRFSITRELGRGSTGRVYLGHDPVIARDVAIKTFHPGLSGPDRKPHEQQLINEARAAGRLSHPNIVTIYDASSEGGTTYIAMELLQGCELQKMLDGGTRFRPGEVAAIAWKLADALDHMHRNAVIHRDIKPANIFMVEDKQPKLMDFGIARSPNRTSGMLAQDDAPYTIFHNDLLGTPNYMSPEQASGIPVDERTDIYSLGTVMYEMLVGRKPFQSDETDKLLHQITHKTPRTPHEIDSRIPPALSQIVMKAMSKRPEKRYSDAASMALDIKRYIAHQKRARRGRQIRKATLEKRGPLAALLQQDILHWIGYLGLAGALALAALSLVSR
ncbi:serine/threonine protein kinase [Noviherbaspirillum massiliense]|uniref:serine/threonine protein kinase n=1 Tax=Noviherbaspirillum massiliense TaxID=1465823 RepID=UPI0002F8BF8E|nr:serine/threonine-protein kinase [Noviherbaspirillum massiliense]